MKNIIVRTISGIIYIALIIGSFFAGEKWFAALSVIFAILAYDESTKLINGPILWRNCAIPVIDMLTMSGLILAFGQLCPLWYSLCLLIIRVIIQLYSHTDNPARQLSISFFQIFYFGIGLGCMLALSLLGKAVLAILIFIWLNDTGAYAIGSLIGKHKLCKKISPKKTIEGFIGGLAITIIASIIFCSKLNDWFAFFPTEQIWEWLLLAIVIVLCSTWGDLIESMIKRTLKIKDSGTLIPGHGGILDRIDSLLLAMPAAWIIFSILGLI